jgi:hypothetical protein
LRTHEQIYEEEANVDVVITNMNRRPYILLKAAVFPLPLLAAAKTGPTSTPMEKVKI